MKGSMGWQEVVGDSPRRCKKREAGEKQQAQEAAEREEGGEGGGGIGVFHAV